MPDYQLALRLQSPNKDRIREFRRGEEDAYTGQAKGRGTHDYDAGYRTGLEERRDMQAIQREKSRSAAAPARTTHINAAWRLLGAR